jgi:hypothetical protein
MTSSPSSDQHAAKQSQLERFNESARQLGRDEDAAAFSESLRQIAKAKPKNYSDKTGAGR